MLTQANREIRLTTVLGDDVLLLRSFSGAESVSSPFSFRLDLASEDPDLSAADILRTPVTLAIDLENGETRSLNGLVNRFARSGQDQELTFYEAEVVPWLWFLDLSTDCRIFQNMSVPEIVENVFRARDLGDFEIRCVRKYPKRDYVVQYRESHLNFVSRLLEDEAIFYFFEHSDTRHVLVLADDNGAMTPLDHKPVVRIAPQANVEEDVITDVRLEYSVRPGRVTLQDYDFEQSEFNLLTTVSGAGEEELFDYHPGRFRTRDEGSRYARLALESLEAGGRTLSGSGNCRAFSAGRRFEIEDHDSRDLEGHYALIRVSHRGRVAEYGTTEGGGYDYTNEFEAVPHEMPYCPPRRHRKPLTRGCQTAVVVGPEGEEVWTDRHGRIKVQFHWDRQGQKDQDSSCWIRVGTPWAGKGWGSITVPRIGNEVIVDFLEGDPDQPIVVGSVYNDDQVPPVDLPARGVQMGMRTRTSPDGRGNNEIMLSDDLGAERIAIQAEHDMSTAVDHDQATTVGNDQSATVGNDRSVTVGNDQATTVGHDQTVTVGNDQRVSVQNDRSVSVAHDESVSVANDQAIDVAVNRRIAVGAEYSLSAGANSSVTVSGGDLAIVTTDGSLLETTKAGHVIASDADVELSAKNVKQHAQAEVTIDGQKLTLTGLAEVKLAVGGNFVKIDPSGVTILGTLVKIN